VFETIKAAERTTGLRVIPAYEDQDGLARGLKDLGPARATIVESLGSPDFKAQLGDTKLLDDSFLLLGLGKKSVLDTDRLRNAGAALLRALDHMDITQAILMLAPAIDRHCASAELAGQAVGEGIGLANWRVDFFDGTAARTKPPKDSLELSESSSNDFRAGMARGLMLAEATNYARRMAATPPNICHPEWVAKEARTMARQCGLKSQVISFAQAKEQGMGGIVSVGQGSAHKPCLIQLEHKPARIAAAARGKRIVLVGKTITFDTGGYSLKPSTGMKGMKYDKCGGMAVLGAMRAIAALDLPVHVYGLMPAAENMVGSDAYRPDDIITMRNGVSVEITNTDAEGRLVLADALAYACKKLKPSALIDIATLTGGIVVALGRWSAGLWCDDSELRGRLDVAAETSGERVWRLPLWDDHRDFMRSKHADIWNSGPKRDAHPIQGAAFLSYFVEDGIPWAHIDIAGVGTVESDTGPFVTGPTGYGVRLLTELVAGYAKTGGKKKKKKN
jgi:leucyl aminopeptidase